MEQQMREIIQQVFADVKLVCDEAGYPLDAEGLADVVGDRMHDDCVEYRNMPYLGRRALLLRVCSDYV